MKIVDTRHPFYRPLWRRVAITGFCMLWTAFELWQGNHGWAVIVGGMAALCAYEFFIAFPKDDDA
ncbi:hypothetical protein ILP92_04295 [Maribius pontilimi]|uniref:DUF3329 domain-containing protein n=1 Tax=Palleronia pontilimi TaxID=1964209 RepID=A0A934IF34_9RHOB|nr:hypothetical protein [Palleronia pontilimi]MBJ3761967.1 hypothetical protein [Palleronia pontilimi]